MPTTRKRHLQQQQRAQQLQQQQLQQQQQPPSTDQHDKQSNDMDTTDCPPHQAPSRTSLIKNKVDKDETLVPNDQAEKLAVHKDIQALLEGDLYCAICREIYINPVILNCAHSFCRFCLNHWLNKHVGCPSCRMVVVFQTENMALNDIVGKMIKTSSQEFQLERNQSLETRWAAEEQQRKLNIKPMMEQKSFDEQGQPIRVHATQRHSTIRSWRGSNGATIWRTKLDLSGQIIRPEVPDDYSSESSIDTDDDVGDDDDDDEDYDEDEDYLDVGEARNYENEFHGSRDDESSNSTIDIVSDESLEEEESHRIHLNHLNILAGNIAAESDEDYEIGEHDQSDSDSSMQGIESDSSSHSADELFGIWRLVGRRNDDMSTEEEDDEDIEEQGEEGVLESDWEKENTDTSPSDTTSSDENSDDDPIPPRIIEAAAITSESDSNSSANSPSDVDTSGTDTDLPHVELIGRKGRLEFDSDSDY